MVQRNPLETNPNWGVIALCWLSIGFAWAPAVYLMDPSQHGLRAFAEATALSVASFIPWLAATPTIFRICDRIDLDRHRPRNLALFVAGTIVVLPVFAALSRIASFVVASMLGFAEPFGGAAQWLMAITITSLFSVPTWLAVVAIGLVLSASRKSAERERLLANVRLDALRSELNPHFLFNSLGGIAQLAHQSPDLAERAIGSLADIMRSTLAERRRLRPLGDEIASVRDHLELYAVLIEGVSLELEVEPSAWQASVPSHILTPLIENATTHGAPDEDGGFAIALKARREGGALLIELSNPCGSTPGPSGGLGSGISNVSQRLMAVYGDRTSVRATRNRNRFEATMRIPFELSESND